MGYITRYYKHDAIKHYISYQKKETALGTTTTEDHGVPWPLDVGVWSALNPHREVPGAVSEGMWMILDATFKTHQKNNIYQYLCFHMSFPTQVLTSPMPEDQRIHICASGGRSHTKNSRLMQPGFLASRVHPLRRFVMLWCSSVYSTSPAGLEPGETSLGTSRLWICLKSKPVAGASRIQNQIKRVATWHICEAVLIFTAYLATSSMAQSTKFRRSISATIVACVVFQNTKQDSTNFARSTTRIYWLSLEPYLRHAYVPNQE